MRRTLSSRWTAAVLFAAGCQTPLPDAPADAGTTPPTDTGLPPVDTGPEPEPERLRYTPMGCMHMVSTAPDVRDIVRDNTDTFGPMPAPRAVHASWAADPATTVALVWSTDAATRATVVEYGTAQDALTQRATGHVSTGGRSVNTVTSHEVHLCGLTPDTTYYYRVGGEGHWSAVQRIKTAPAPGRNDYDINFAVAGDSRNGYGTLRMVEERVLSVSAMRQPEFQIFSGDAVFLGTNQIEWTSWFDAAAPALRQMPFVMAHGNHDALSINYLMQFAQPQAGVAEQDELYFSYDYGPVHIVVLNDTPFRGDLAGGVAGTQLNWLRQDLTRARANRGRVPWIVVVHHKPAFSSSRHSDAMDTVFVRRTWPPLFDEFGVDVVFNGHDHQFEVSKELDGMGREVQGRRGTVYFTTAGAGAELYPTGNQPWKRYAESVSNFLLVHVTNRVFEVTPYRLDGTIIAEGRTTLQPRP